ncbi:hypothetical protein ASPCAL09725 [Aspergillus calidoustus]|uniref:BZIP domain-containing protein n=1 Tax=Aspergillus calidoustus TaxID=454130 RepID=A0A0U5G8A1_ASPCI|nr:hypothetical protein ASPCAL09725 [Aspergillus calidoustus]
MTPTPTSISLAPIALELGDEWKGVLDPQRRRTLQNRLNQRAHRRRLKAAKLAKLSDEAPGDKSSDLPSPPVNREHAQDNDNGSPVHNASKSPSATSTSVAVTGTPAATFSPSPAPPHSSPSTKQITFIELDRFKILGPTAPKCRRALQHLESFYRAEIAAGSLRTELLLGLTRLNFLRALHANIDVLGYSAAEMHDDAQSPFGVPSAAKPGYSSVERLPVSLRPTPIQLSTPHHPWLDLIPFPQLRDNLIRLGDALDDTQLCFDMSGRGSATGVPDKRLGNAGGETGVIVWRDPWDPSGWEVTETFWRRWHWVLRDCTEVMRVTDSWRRVRGEPGLFQHRVVDV